MVQVHTIDLEYLDTPGAVAAYVVSAPAGPFLVETGPGSTTDRLTAGLRALGLTPGDIKHVFVTHIHFDHAGAAGWMAAHGATVHVHSFGAKHLVDPSRLWASAERIYGDSMERRWGSIVPIPANQVNAVAHGQLVDVGGLRVRAIETPGHAKHHHAWAVETPDSHVCFTGDAAACFVAEAPAFISLPTPPPEFELAAWLASVTRLEREHFDRLYPTHFGAVDEPRPHLARVRTALREHADFVGTRFRAGIPEADIRSQYRDWWLGIAQNAGVPEAKVGFYVLDTLAEMNVSGLLRYWTKLDAKLAAQS